MQQKLFNLQLPNQREINFMDEQSLINIHQKTIAEIFSARKKAKPIVTQQGVELCENRFNNDVDKELSEIHQLLVFIETVIHKHQKHNYQEKLQRVLNDMGDVVSSASADFGTLFGEVEDNLDSEDLMTIDELEEYRKGGNPDDAYDEFRESQGANHA